MKEWRVQLLFWSEWWWHTEFQPLDSTVQDNIRYISVVSASAVLSKPRQELVNAMYSIWEEASADAKKDKKDKKLPEVFSVIDNVEVVTQDELWRLLSYFYPDKC